jgi:hypothetical protein
LRRRRDSALAGATRDSEKLRHRAAGRQPGARDQQSLQAIQNLLHLNLEYEISDANGASSWNWRARKRRVSSTHSNERSNSIARRRHRPTDGLNATVERVLALARKSFRTAM